MKQAKLFHKKRGVSNIHNKTFTIAKQKFDAGYKNVTFLKDSLVPVNGEIAKDVRLRNEKGERLEEYYKWQFIYALIHSGLYFKDYIGVEIYFPKGTKGANPIKIDACIFDSKDWLEYYQGYKKTKSQTCLEFLRRHCIAVIDFKRGDEDIEQVFTEQLRAYIKEPDGDYILGILYDAERLYVFQRENATITRYDNSKNQNKKTRTAESLSLHLTDPYSIIPSFDELILKIKTPIIESRANRTIEDLDIITSITSIQIKDGLSNILKTLDKTSLVDERGYRILIQTIALKIFDEKTNQKFKNKTLRFYIEENEKHYKSLHEDEIQTFIKRIRSIYDDAESHYQSILKEQSINWKNENHVRVVVSIVDNFQDYSFVRSQKSDLYQLVFYNFATKFKKEEKAQFLTPLPLIDFLVKIVNPRGNETVFDPCVGIADFLSLAYVNSDPSLDDSNLWGADNDESMVMLATLNMLLNGDGNAHILYVADKGSIDRKISKKGNIVQLIPRFHKNGNWDKWKNGTKLMKYDVILTNPPFGKGRSYEAKSSEDREIIELYELWNLHSKKGKQQRIDQGIVFLENAYRMLKVNGRFGIVLSNSIAGIDSWRFVRDWLMDGMRIVALFDLPPQVFAETGVNPTLIVAYKPRKDELDRLKRQNYEVFVKDVKKIGYEKKTIKRNVVFEPSYKLDLNTFEIVIDSEGNPVLDEEFTQTIKEFKSWALSQEETLQKLFVGEENS